MDIFRIDRLHGLARRDSEPIRRLLAEIRRARPESHPTRRFLARIHRGDAFTLLFALALKVLVWIVAPIFTLVWLVRWSVVYYEFERWELVLAFFDQLVVLGLCYALCHLTLLRAEHLRKLPPDELVTLRGTTLIVRWVGEFALILALGLLALAVIGVPSVGWMTLLGVGPGTEIGGDLKLASKLVSLVATGIFQAAAFALFILCYALAGAIEVVLAIEKNTRVRERGDGAEMVAGGREIADGRGTDFPSYGE